nr:hypothetical protein [Thermoplasmata archaeon]NIS10400.1 hypothetical protein [Thermoplasmata archaeon]NIS18387.1 hypothetical protein [Thermoplasmata archaeon]NIT75370.1 hypothetical protein [Thermoplasmata archaeon]NIU47542.1 hypothetical protein [Thermoplasmata archaeon]
MTGEDRRGWDELPSDDPTYDPQGRNDDGPRGDPYGPQYAEPRYSYQPPPPAYAQYPPPVYSYPYGYPTPYQRPANPGLAVAGGALSLIAGSLGIVWNALVLSQGAMWIFPAFGWCAVVGLVLSIIAIIGGIMAMMKRMFPVAILGAVCAMLNFAAFGVGFFLGLLA